MVSSSGGTPLLICTACGKPQAEGRHLCEHCGAPLTPFAHTDWLLGVQSRGFAARQASTEPRKLIVVVGMWLWLLPMLGMGLFFVVGGAGFLREAWDRETSSVIPALLYLTFGWGLFLLAAAILFKTTRSYIWGRRISPVSSHDVEAAVESDDGTSAEPLECLDCGQPFPAEAKCCPACGWSYSSES